MFSLSLTETVADEGIIDENGRYLDCGAEEEGGTSDSR